MRQRSEIVTQCLGPDQFLPQVPQGLPSSWLPVEAKAKGQYHQVLGEEGLGGWEGILHLQVGTLPASCTFLLALCVYPLGNHNMREMLLLPPLYR